MAEKHFQPLGLTVMTLSAGAVAVYSFRYYGVLANDWPGIGPEIHGVIAAVPIRALTHMLIAPIALLLGPFQFIPGLRVRYPRFHHWSGRAYVLACVIAGIGGLATAPHASGGPVAGLGFGILAVLWVGTTLAGWQAALRRRIGLHRLLMRFSYAMTFAAVTYRLQIPIGLAIGFKSYAPLSVWLAYTSWIPNVIVVALYSVMVASRRAVPVSAAVGQMSR